MLPGAEEIAPGIEILRGDCRQTLEGLPDNSFDAIITDPPYGVELGKRPNAGRKRQCYDVYDDTPENLERLISWFLPLARRVARRVILTPSVKNFWVWPRSDHTGCFYHPGASGCNTWGFSCRQPILYYGKDPYLVAGLGSRPDSIHSCEQAKRDGHPCRKPVGMWTWLVERCSLPGESVLDPLMGSGTTGICCLRSKRRFAGIELSEDYYSLAKTELQQEISLGKRTIWECKRRGAYARAIKRRDKDKGLFRRGK